MIGAHADRVIKEIDERELIDLALHLSNIESPRGEEGECAEAIFQWCVRNDFPARRVGMFEDRFNVFAELPADGRGPALAFNSHIDTWMHRNDRLIFRDPNRADYHGAWEDGEMLVGNPLVNDKGPMAAFMIATKAIRDAGVELSGSVYMTMVAGEIGMEPVDEFQGKAYLSKEVGARYLVNHTPRASFCLCAEGTGFRKGWIEAGKAFYKLTVYGGGAVYTPYFARPSEGLNPNAIIRAVPVLGRIEEWALEYEQRHRYEGPGGTVVPRVNIGAIRAGEPSMLLQNPDVCLIYLDIRTVPDQPTEEIGFELREILEAEGVEGGVEQFLNRPSYEAKGIQPLSDALDEAHRYEFGSECELAGSPECSMWRDHLVFNEVGIPALTYGPSSLVGAGRFTMPRGDLLHAARVYALTALALCGAS